MDRKRVVIFAGAGASKAVSEDYPTTIEFFQKLPDSIKRNKFFVAAEQHIKSQGNEGALDIEMILWELQKISTLGQTVGGEGFIGWLLSAQRLPKLMEQKVDAAAVVNLIKKARKDVEELIDRINEYVYHFYGSSPDGEKLEKNWNALFRFLDKTGSKVDIFTTNYDLIIEHSLQCVGVASVGWEGEVVRKLNMDLWEDGSKRSTEKGLLTKLHGSINWSRGPGDRGQIFVGGPDFKGKHSNHVIIYPGFKGRPGDSPFDTFHAHLERCVARADVVLFVGFAFRDEYINEVFERSIRKDCGVCSINPSGVKVPFSTNRNSNISEPFGESSVGAATDFIGRCIDFDVVDLL
ncbi:hypothetical protein ASALC70_02493 [Alcanivorax sp. ALC70]|nr:hypothetical protein ASALC70_02493 [Alcanivorax sp. ALC70]